MYTSLSASEKEVSLFLLQKNNADDLDLRVILKLNKGQIANSV